MAVNNKGMSGKQVVKILALGGLLAGLFWAVQGPPETDAGLPEIVVSEADVVHQSARWQKTWGRKPTADELKKAVDGYVRNEILYREALARRMDREDPRVRMALIQKMQMLAAGQADAQGVSEEGVASFYALKKEQYRIPARFSIKQVLFKESEDATERARQLLKQFAENEPTDAALHESGDVTLLKTALSGITAQELERQFGSDFTADVLSAPADKWVGPVYSGYGLHVVKVFDVVPGRIPGLAEVRDQVENDMLYEMREISREQGYQEVAGKYRIMMSEGAEQLLNGEPL